MHRIWLSFLLGAGRLVGQTLLVATGCTEEVAACEVSFDITLPEAAGADVASVTGSVEISGLDGPVDVVTEGGNITLTNLDGPVGVVQGHGEILLDGLSGRLDVHGTASSIDGVDLEVGVVQVTGGTGDVSLAFSEVPDLVVVRTARGSIDIQVPAGTYDVQTTVGRGDVTLREITNSNHADSVMFLTTTSGDISVRGE